MNYRFSGHETFPCRYTWLPKAVRSVQQNLLERIYRKPAEALSVQPALAVNENAPVYRSKKRRAPGRTRE